MKKTDFLALCCMVLIYVLAPAPSAVAGEVPSPIFTDPHYHGSADPEIVWNSHEGEWWIFYTARRALREDGTAAACPIGVAKSKDLVSWDFAGYCKFDGSGGKPDANHTYWAPAVVSDGNTYHMFVTYKPLTTGFWGGRDVWIRHYKAPADDLIDGWVYVNDAIKTPEAIDAGLIKKDGEWLMYYRAKEDGAEKMGTYYARSKNLVNWERMGLAAGDVNDRPVTGYGYQEAQYPFCWQGRYWLLTDPTGADIAIYSSDDALDWKFNNSLLSKAGERKMDNSQGRHPSVAVIGDRAFIFYHVEPFRDYSKPYPKNKPEQKRTCLQMAELELKNGKVVCDRNKPLLIEPENVKTFARRQASKEKDK